MRKENSNEEIAETHQSLPSDFSWTLSSSASPFLSSVSFCPVSSANMSIAGAGAGAFALSNWKEKHTLISLL